MWRILIALAWPAFAVGWVLTFFGIMRELSASILLYSVGSEVLSVVLLKMWTNGNAEQVSVIGLMMMLLVIMFRWVQLRVIKRRISYAIGGSDMGDVTLDNVSRAFGPVTAVDRINLHVGRGEFVTLLGPSGCGKTTTLRMVAGLEQNTSGRIAIGDTVVSDAATGFFLPPEKRRLGMVFQSYAIWPHMTVFDNVAYPLRVRRRSAAEIKGARRPRARSRRDGAVRRATRAGSVRWPAAARRHRARPGVRTGSAAARRAAQQPRRPPAHPDG